MSGVPQMKVEHSVNGSWVDVSSRVLWGDSGGPVQMVRGVTEGGGSMIGTASLVLDNSDGALTPRKVPYMTRYRPVRISSYINSVWRPRHYGFITEQPLTFQGEQGAVCLVTWSTIDLFGMAALRPLRSVAVETVAAAGPVAYWPLTETESAAAADQSGNSRPGLAVQQWKTGGQVAWATGAVLPADSSGGIVFTPQSDAGVFLRTDNTIDLPASWSLSVMPTPAAKDGYLVQVGTDSYSIGIWYDTSTKKLSAIETKLDNDGDPIDYVLSTTTGTWAGGMETLTVTATTVKLGSSGTTGTRHNSDVMLGSLVSVGGALAVESGRARMYSGEIKHLALWTGTVPAAVTTATLTNGPAAMLLMSTAIQRVLSWAGLTVTVNTLGTDQPVVLVKSDGVTAFELIDAYARGSLARIFCAGDGTVTVRAYDYTSTAITATAGVIDPNIEWADPEGDVTSATMTWPDGAVYTASRTVAGNRSGVDLPGVLTPATGRSVADWVVASSSSDPNFARAPFDLLTLPNSEMYPLALLDPGSILIVPGLPSQLPAASQRGEVGTITETVSATSWDVEVTVSADARSRLLVVGDATRGEIDAGYLAAPFGVGIAGQWRAGDEITAAKLNGSASAAVSVQTGALSITPTTANTPESQSVTFPVAFPSAPSAVVLTPVDMAVGSNITGWSATSITTTGFLAWACRTNLTPVYLQWVAVL